MHQLLFIRKIIFFSTCFEPQVLIFRRYSCTHAAYGTVTLYESSWWPVGTQLCTDRPPRTVTVQYAACVQLYPPEDEHLRFETCRGEYYFTHK